MNNSTAMFAFSIFEGKYPFLKKFVPKIKTVEAEI